ncbi:MAG: trypsin-like peptidase domain-containing protein [Rhizomicrobium sp.]|jgi:S1-C subfamily serine protease
MRRLCIAFLTLALAGCETPSGEPAAGFASPKIADAYIPLEGPVLLIFKGDAAAVSLGGSVAVTNAHNANLLDAKSVIGKSLNYDILFFHTDKATAELPTAEPHVSQLVIAYGQAKGGTLRTAEGVVTRLDAPVEALCRTCEVQSAFTFEGNAGPGFSGGPVLDAKDGKLLGIVFGFVDRPAGKGRTMYAYTMQRVFAELDNVTRKLPMDRD